jgi:hypothetical protein
MNKMGFWHWYWHKLGDIVWSTARIIKNPDHEELVGVLILASGTWALVLAFPSIWGNALDYLVPMFFGLSSGVTVLAHGAYRKEMRKQNGKS